MAFGLCLAPCGAAVTLSAARRKCLAVGHVSDHATARACGQIAAGDSRSVPPCACAHERLFGERVASRGKPTSAPVTALS